MLSFIPVEGDYIEQVRALESGFTYAVAACVACGDLRSAQNHTVRFYNERAALCRANRMRDSAEHWEALAADAEKELSNAK